MAARDLFHGGNGDKILHIIRTRQMEPDAQNRIFFSENRYDSVLMHGGDLKRKLTLAVKVRVQIPEGARLDYVATPGVPDTVVLNTAVPVKAEVLELYVRRPRSTAVEIVQGSQTIERFLSSTG